MDLRIPEYFRKNINPYSNYLDIYPKRDVKGLFYTTENRIYLARELYALITNESYVRQNMPDPEQRDIDTPGPDSLYGSSAEPYSFIDKFNNDGYLDKAGLIVRAFRTRRDMIDRVMQSLIEVYQMPFQEDWAILNPVQQLHWVNTDFLVKASRNIIQDPENLTPGISAINPDTGKFEGNLEYQYTAESYSDGTWHPEHLFTLSQRNRNNPYWVPLEVNYHSDPNAKGPGHRYNDILYNWGTRRYYESKYWKDGTPKVGARRPPIPGGPVQPRIIEILQQNPADPNSDFSYGQFPDWQTTVNVRAYDRDVTLGLKNGGINDRRVQTPGGYDMSKLKKKSTYNRTARYSRYT